MSNRRRLRFGKKRTNSFRQRKISTAGIAKIFNDDDRAYGQERYPTADEMFSGAGLPDDEKAQLAKLTMPASEAEVIKVVPAKVDGVEVGTAYIHDDGQVSIMFHEDAPDDKLEKIKATSMSVGYNLETGEDSGSA